MSFLYAKIYKRTGRDKFSVSVYRKKQEEEEQKETRKPERKGRHPKYGEGEIISEDEMMIELEFPGYGKKQFLKAFGEVEVLKGL